MTEKALGQYETSYKRKQPVIYSSTYLELAGNGIIYSINVDIVSENRGLRLGLVPFGLTQSYENPGMYNEPFARRITTDAFMMVLMGHYLIGEEASKLEVGGGFLLGDVSNIDWDHPDPPGLTFTIGYRYIPQESGDIMLRVGFTPLLSDGIFYPRIGISVGFMLTGDDL